MNLRKCTIEDAQILHKELGCNPEMMKYTGWNPYSTLDAARKFLEFNVNSEDGYSWIIEEDGEAVGTIGAYDFNSEDGSIEIGYSIFQKSWGKGYASEAVNKACSILFSGENIKCIKAWSAVDNAESARVLEKNGFRKTMVKEAAINVDGESYDQIIYERLKTEQD